MKRYWLIASITTLLTVGTAFAQSLPINQLPMYGEREKTVEMKNADAELIAAVEKLGLTRPEAAKRAIQTGWSYWEKRDLATAMLRFNQAWLLDPENGNAYHGFALVTSDRRGAPVSIGGIKEERRRSGVC